MTIDILLADDHPVVRESLMALLEVTGDLRVVGVAGDGREAVAKAAELAPDVVVMDISMPGMDGIEATRHIRTARPQARVVVLSMFGDAEHVHRALEAGATGYVLKESAGTDLVAAIREVHAGRQAIK